MKPNIGDQVLITKINKHGRIVDVNPDSSVMVEIGSIKIRCKPEDFRITGTAKGFDRGSVTIKAQSNRKGGTARIDLHGMTVADGLRATEDALNKALLNGNESLEIIHGIGSGALKKAIQGYLKNAPGVANISISSSNPGSTLVYLNC